MSMITMPVRESAHVLNEIEGMSKDTITVIGGIYPSGTVLGRLDNGNYTQLDITNGASEATEAVAILYGHTDAKVVTTAQAHTRLTAVYEQRLTWPTNITTAQKEAAITALETKHIILR